MTWLETAEWIVGAIASIGIWFFEHPPVTTTGGLAAAFIWWRARKAGENWWKWAAGFFGAIFGLAKLGKEARHVAKGTAIMIGVIGLVLWIGFFALVPSLRAELGIPVLLVAWFGSLFWWWSKVGFHAPLRWASYEEAMDRKDHWEAATGATDAVLPTQGEEQHTIEEFRAEDGSLAFKITPRLGSNVEELEAAANSGKWGNALNIMHGRKGLETGFAHVEVIPADSEGPGYLRAYTKDPLASIHEFPGFASMDITEDIARLTGGETE